MNANLCDKCKERYTCNDSGKCNYCTRKQQEQDGGLKRMPELNLELAKGHGEPSIWRNPRSRQYHRLNMVTQAVKARGSREGGQISVIRPVSLLLTIDQLKDLQRIVDDAIKDYNLAVITGFLEESEVPNA